MDRYDIIIVGGGPGGATFARQAALKGFRTILFEKESFPRSKVCGGGLTPAVADLLGFDHRSVIDRVVTGVTFLSRDDPDETTWYPGGMAIEMVSRRDFDHLLIRKAAEAGAVIADATRVVSVTESRQEAVVETAAGDRVRGLIVVGADGARGVVAESAGLKRGVCGIGIEGEFFPRDGRMPDGWTDRAVFGFGFVPRGYGWVFPKKDHFSVGIGTGETTLPGLRRLYEAFTERFPFLKEASENERRGWFIPFNDNSGSVNTRRICLVGDSARLADPFSGEGIYYAVLSGVIAAETVWEELGTRGRLSQSYSKKIASRITRDFAVARWCNNIFYAAPPFFYRRERVIRALIRLSRKEIDYRGIIKELRKKTG